VRDALQTMINWGIIERCYSEYLNPILPVVKADGSVRPCLDGKKINEIIIPDREKPCPPDEVLQKYHGVQWLSSTDMSSSYWQVKLHPNSKKFTAFMFDNKTYWFNVVPFGLNISVAAFSRCVEYMLGSELNEFITYYVDDLLCASPGDVKNHLDHLNM
jgi:hypothetical protein